MSDATPLPATTTLVAPIAQTLRVPAEFADASPEMRRRATELAAKLDWQNSSTLLTFGIDAQKKLTAHSETMLANVRNADSGAAGETLSTLMLQFKGLKLDQLQAAKNPLKNAFLFLASPLARFQQRFETVSAQISETVHRLEGDRLALSRDVVSLEGLFLASLDQYKELTVYILAGEEKITAIDNEILPALQRQAEESKSMLDAQSFRDAQNARNELDRRLHNLRLTKTATLQSLPQIRLIQDVNKSLVDKIQTSIITTIPIWKQQIAIAITLFRQEKALSHEKAVTDTTNELLRQNATLLQTQNRSAREQVERGVIDLETLRQVNDSLLRTIEDTVRISSEAKDKRIAAAREMSGLETTLKDALRGASAPRPA